MTYPANHHHPAPAASSSATASAETSTNSLAPYTPPNGYQNPPPPRGNNDDDIEKGALGDESGGDDGAPEVVAQSSRTVALKERAREFGDGFLERLPYPVAHFLGHRKGEPDALHQMLAIFWAFVGVMGSILLIELATVNIPAFKDNGSPVIIASFVRSSTLRPYFLPSSTSIIYRGIILFFGGRDCFFLT